jgi:hypothetical protein
MASLHSVPLWYNSYTQPPHYTIQSADANVTTVQVTDQLTANALGMTLVHVKLQAPSQAYVVPLATTTTLYTSSQLVFTQGSQLQLSGSGWTVQAGDSSVGQGLWLPLQTVIQLPFKSVWVVNVQLVTPSVVSVSLLNASSLTAQS